MNTTSVKKNQIVEKWYTIDVNGVRIGKAASRVAELLLGKNNPLIKAYLDPQVKVVVVNAEKVDFTPKRGMTKFYRTYSGYPGGLKVISLEEQFKKDPVKPIEHAIKGMLPKNKRGKAIFTKNLFIYSGETHPHDAQKPEAVKITK